MCLAIPAEVIELRERGRALVSLDGVRREVSVELLDAVQVGDYVIVHVGYALTRLDPEEARRTLAMIAAVALQSQDAEDSDHALRRRVP